MSNLTLGSLFDGSGGFPLGGLLAGITPIWASEIEPFPIAVTKKRLSFMKHYGDISQMNGGEIEPVDIITFGSPCQDMSVAGKRDGLDGKRSSLFYEAVRIIKEMRCKTDGKYPRYIVWENVPGAFSSNKGEDFRCVLESICQIKEDKLSVPRPEKWPYAGSIVGDGFSVAWRLLDAQYWGVPQRRKRIFLVADFNGGSAGEVLFESEGLSGYTPQGFRPRKDIAGDFETGAGETGCYSVDGYNSAMDNVEATLGVNCGVSTGRNGLLVLNDQGGSRMDVTEEKTCTLRAESHHPPLVFENHSQDCRYRGPDDISQTVLSTFGTGGNNQPFVVETPKTMKIRCGKEGGGKGPLVQDNKSATLSCNNDQTLFQPKVYGICAKDSNSMKSDNPNSGFYEAKTTRCLDGNGGNPSCNQGGMAVVALEGNGSRPSHHGDGYSAEDISYTLNATEHHAVAYGLDRAAFNQGKNALYDFAALEELEPTIVAKGPGAVAQPAFSSSKASFFTKASEETANCLVATDWKDPPLVNDSFDYIVRRLTPTECRDSRTGGAMISVASILQTKMCMNGTRCLKHTAGLSGLRENPKRKNKSGHFLKNPIPTLRNTRCGATELLFLACILCFPALSGRTVKTPDICAVYFSHMTCYYRRLE